MAGSLEEGREGKGWSSWMRNKLPRKNEFAGGGFPVTRFGRFRDSRVWVGFWTRYSRFEKGSSIRQFVVRTLFPGNLVISGGIGGSIRRILKEISRVLIKGDDPELGRFIFRIIFLVRCVISGIWKLKRVLKRGWKEFGNGSDRSFKFVSRIF